MEDRWQSEPLLAGLQHPALDASSTAVVVVDMINYSLALVDWFERVGLPSRYLRDRIEQVVVPNHVRLLTAARRAGAAVVYLRQGCTRADFADAHRSLAPIMRELGARDGEWACEVIDAIKPEDGDVSILKTGSGGFTTSALDTHLRNIGIEHVLYTGVMTNACVMLTIAAGFDLGYHNYLVTDATATSTQDWQNKAEELMGLYLSENITTDVAVSLLSRASSA